MPPLVTVAVPGGGILDPALTRATTRAASSPTARTTTAAGWSRWPCPAVASDLTLTESTITIPGFPAITVPSFGGFPSFRFPGTPDIQVPVVEVVDAQLAGPESEDP